MFRILDTVYYLCIGRNSQGRKNKAGVFQRKRRKDMKQVGKFKMYTSEEVLDRHFGKVGTPRRDEFEQGVALSIHAYELGEAIKKARVERNFT